MGSNTRVDRSIGKKFGGLLKGLLGGLYDTSSLVANTDFSTAMPISSDSGNLPYKGSGLFGGLKAKGANANFMAQNAMAELNSNRQLKFLKESLPLQNEAAISLTNKQNEIEDARGFKKLGDTGAALGIALGNLPGNQLQSLNPPITFKSPQEQANWYQAAYGSLPVGEAPLKALNTANQLEVQSKPEVLQSLINQEINKGLTTVGDSKIDITGKQVYEGSGVDYEEQLVPITKSVLNPETGNMEEQVVSYKTTRIPRRRQAGVMNLADYRITPEDVAANAGVENNFITTDNPPVTSANRPRPLMAKPPVIQPQAETVPASGNFVDRMHNFGVMAGNKLQTMADPVADTLNGIVYNMHENEQQGRGLPPIDYGQPLPIPQKDLIRYLQNRANSKRFNQIPLSAK